MTNNSPTSTEEHPEIATLRSAAPEATNKDLPGPARSEPSSITLLKKWFSFPAFLGAILVAANFAIVRGLRLDPDTWWHLKYGDMILQTGRWPTVDTWSFTVHGMPRIAYEWGGEVLTALAYRMGGLRGMDVLLITLTSIIVILTYYFAWLRCRNSYAAFFATFILLPIAVLCFTLRPQLIGYIFLLVTLILLERFRLGEQKNLWAVPVIFLLWVNTHGTFVLGFMVLGLYWLSGLVSFESGGLYAVRWRPEQRLHIETVGLLSVAVLPLTPYGTRLAAVPLSVIPSPPLNFYHVAEWQPINTDFWQAKLLLIFLFGFILAQCAFRFRYRLEELSLFLIGLYAAFVHVRFVILLAIIFAPLLASIFVPWAPAYDPRKDKYVLNAALTFVAMVAFVMFIPSETALQKNISKDNPVKAVRYIQEHPALGRMFNSYNFGGYLVWSLTLQRKVFIDGRGDVYDWAGVFSDYADVVDLKPDALAVLQSYRVDFCLIRPQGALATLLRGTSDWKEIYTDTVSAIFVRRATRSPLPHSSRSIGLIQGRTPWEYKSFPRS
ncbi:MAG TPA: hypothetical protein VJW77_10710 [Terriglobia bacterium]|nr:hypothetical protein [Terriglobia bacterium]